MLFWRESREEITVVPHHFSNSSYATAVSLAEPDPLLPFTRYAGRKGSGTQQYSQLRRKTVEEIRPHSMNLIKNGTCQKDFCASESYNTGLLHSWIAYGAHRWRWDVVSSPYSRLAVGSSLIRQLLVRKRFMECGLTAFQNRWLAILNYESRYVARWRRVDGDLWPACLNSGAGGYLSLAT